MSRFIPPKLGSRDSDMYTENSGWSSHFDSITDDELLNIDLENISKSPKLLTDETKDLIESTNQMLKKGDPQSIINHTKSMKNQLEKLKKLGENQSKEENGMDHPIRMTTKEKNIKIEIRPTEKSAESIASAQDNTAKDSMLNGKNLLVKKEETRVRPTFTGINTTNKSLTSLSSPTTQFPIKKVDNSTKPSINRLVSAVSSSTPRFPVKKVNDSTKPPNSHPAQGTKNFNNEKGTIKMVTVTPVSKIESNKTQNDKIETKIVIDMNNDQSRCRILMLLNSLRLEPLKLASKEGNVVDGAKDTLTRVREEMIKKKRLEKQALSKDASSKEQTQPKEESKKRDFREMQEIDFLVDEADVVFKTPEQKKKKKKVDVFIPKNEIIDSDGADVDDIGDDAELSEDDQDGKDLDDFINDDFCVPDSHEDDVDTEEYNELVKRMQGTRVPQNVDSDEDEDYKETNEKEFNSDDDQDVDSEGEENAFGDLDSEEDNSLEDMEVDKEGEEEELQDEETINEENTEEGVEEDDEREGERDAEEEEALQVNREKKND